MPAAAAPLVLASGSPRRRELLAGLGLAFTVRPAALDETPRDGEGAVPYVERLAREKARAVAAPGEVVLAADTVVEEGGELLGKPADAAEARAMLARLAGRGHAVHTGVAVVVAGGEAGDLREAVEVATTRVRFAPMSEEEIGWYVASGEPMDKAGAYGIQGLAGLFVEGIEGNWSNVVGLPLPEVYRAFRRLGEDLLARIGG